MKKNKKDIALENENLFENSATENSESNTAENFFGETEVTESKKSKKRAKKEKKGEAAAFDGDVGEEVAENFFGETEVTVSEKSKKRARKEKKEQGVVFDEDVTDNVTEKPVKVNNKTKKYGGLTAITILLYVLSFGIIIGLSMVLAIKSFNLAPYYTFWPFLGIIIVGVFALVFAIVALVVNKRKSKRSVRNQTICLIVTFFCLTAGFGILLNVALPDLISMATQSTLYTDDIYTNGSKQVEVNVALNRQFIRYNLLNGNYQWDLSYANLSKNTKGGEKGDQIAYIDEDINKSYTEYVKMAENGNTAEDFALIITGLTGQKKELYDFIKQSYVFMDYEYAFKTDVTKRNCFALALTDKIYPKYDYLCKVGFSDPRLEYLRVNNFTSMDQDGYQTFDDPLLLYAQMEGRMTIPAVVRLILDDRYTLTQPKFDENGKIQGYDGFLYEGYDEEIYNEYAAAVKAGTESWDENGVGVNDMGYIIHKETRMVQRPMKWCVLDMDGNNMEVAKVDILGLSIGGMKLGPIIAEIINGGFTEPIGDLLENGLGNIIEIAAGGAKLELHLYFDDAGQLAIEVVPMNAQYGLLGYMQMSWMNSNNLLVGVINLVSIRNNLFIYGAVGLVLIFGACLIREYVRKRKQEDAEKKEKEDKENGGSDVSAGEPIAV